MSTFHERIEPQPPYDWHRPIVNKKTGEVWAYCDGPQGIFAPYRVGHLMPVREPWMISGFIDVGAAYGSVCSDENLHKMKYVLQYKDSYGDWQSGRTIWPNSPDYAEARKLVTCYADEGRERDADSLPDWAVRTRLPITAIAPVQVDGVWNWAIEVQQENVK